MRATLMFEHGLLTIVVEGRLGPGEINTVTEAIESLPPGSDAVVDLTDCRTLSAQQADGIRTAITLRQHDLVSVGVALSGGRAHEAAASVGLPRVAAVARTRSDAAARLLRLSATA